MNVSFSQSEANRATVTIEAFSEAEVAALWKGTRAMLPEAWNRSEEEPLASAVTMPAAALQADAIAMDSATAAQPQQQLHAGQKKSHRGRPPGSRKKSASAAR